MVHTHYPRFDENMKFIPSLTILLILLCFYVPCVSADISLENISQVTIEVPPTGTAVLGTKESMTEYQAWLDESAFRLVTYCNTILNIFGMKSMDWEQKIPVSSTVTPASTIQATVIPTPTPAIPLSSRVKTVGSITGGSGVTKGNISVPTGYWELTYTVDPLIRGGQDSHSATGSNSAVFPTLSIQITDLTTGKVFDTVEPSGEMDPTLWERTDPRPWYKRYYVGDREFGFVVTARNVKSFTIEARVPVKTTEQSSSGVPSESPTVNSSKTGESQRVHIVAVNVFRQGSGVRVIYQGGPDAATLHYITITVNGEYIGEMGAENGETPLPIGTRATFQVTDSGSGYYVIGTGHFAGEVTQKIFETTL